jgi:FkbH-like protein
VEPVRLLIWDLDGVFWQGVLSEGSMQYVRRHHDIVVELARRGILSSICSKNDLAAVRAVLQEQNLWWYFVFPSIDWAPKGQRIAALIEEVQLRPASVLFIDDEPANLAEAVHYVPELQTASPLLIPELLQDCRFTGKDDAGLSRLKQYKSLQRKAAARRDFGYDNAAFLRASDIRVSIDYDVEANIERAIELINRTNQLNFTKRRLPEDMEAARAELRQYLRRGSHSGLIKASDRYGDYGYIGFFSAEGFHWNTWLKHFCFSCRVLDMGIERWMYRRLGSPKLWIAGEVACRNLTSDSGEIDWITLVEDSQLRTQARQSKIADRLVMRGGCDFNAMWHYFAPRTGELHLEVARVREDRQFRIDHSAFLDLVFAQVSPPVQQALESIGYIPSDWTSALALPAKPGARTVWMFSFWNDTYIQLYKHNVLDLVVQFHCERNQYVMEDITALPEELVRKALSTAANLRAYEALKRDFCGIGPVSEAAFRAALGRMLDAARGQAMVIIMLLPEHWRETETGPVIDVPESRLNPWIRAAVAGRPEVHLVDIVDFETPGATRESALHFDRLTYCRAAEHILSLISARFAAEDDYSQLSA